MTYKVIPSANEFDDLIERLEADLRWQNARLANTRGPNGTMAVYLRKRIQTIGIRLAETRKDRIKYHGKPSTQTKAKASHRSALDPTASSLAANRLVKHGKPHKTRSSGKH